MAENIYNYIAHNEQGELKIASISVTAENEKILDGWYTIKKSSQFLTNDEGYLEKPYYNIIHLFIPKWSYELNGQVIEKDSYDYFIYNNPQDDSVDNTILENIPLEINNGILQNAYEIIIKNVNDKILFKVIYKDYANNNSTLVPKKVKYKILNNYYIV